jgi:hypothetical protein
LNPEKRKEGSQMVVNFRLALRMVSVLLLGALLGGYRPISAQPGATKAQASKAPTRKRSETLAAIQAVGVGNNIYQWLTYSLDPKPSAAAQMGLQSSEMALEVGSGILEVSLSPSPRQARMDLPKDGPARVDAAFAAAKKLKEQVAQATRSNEYLFSHYVVGSLIGQTNQMVEGNLIPSNGDVILNALDQLPQALNTGDYFDYAPLSLRRKVGALIASRYPMDEREEDHEATPTKDTVNSDCVAVDSGICRLSSARTN